MLAPEEEVEVELLWACLCWCLRRRWSPSGRAHTQVSWVPPPQTKISTGVVRGRAKGQVSADPGARTPISASGNGFLFSSELLMVFMEMSSRFLRVSEDLSQISWQQQKNFYSVLIFPFFVVDSIVAVFSKRCAKCINSSTCTGKGEWCSFVHLDMGCNQLLFGASCA